VSKFTPKYTPDMETKYNYDIVKLPKMRVNLFKRKFIRLKICQNVSIYENKFYSIDTRGEYCKTFFNVITSLLA
jgi:hypothetical protein